ncbi:hypothetical protein Tco_0924971 [Tanacetum coccineum]|uniref:Uncharacterized protein n=1 Tax=Tanacetum coccineum TaxID=301880 RepID=A0ABQ5D6V9_9ASTR
MAQPQTQADVHQDELCSPKKRYALMDANKNIDLYHQLCPNESKIMENILQNHPLRFIIAASSSVPWIYMEATPPTPILTTTEAEDIILQDTIQLSIAEQKSHDVLEANQNVKKVEEHLIVEEIEKLVEGIENVQNVEVEKTVVVSQPVNVIEEEDELAEDDYELKRRGKGRM